MSKVIGIVGSRRRDSTEDYNLCLRAFIDIYEQGDSIVSGGCPKGGDNFAELIAEIYEIPIVIHLAKWDQYGRAAGPIRNTLIADDCDVLIAVVAADRTGGTEDTVRKVEAQHKLVMLV